MILPKNYKNGINLANSLARHLANPDIPLIQRALVCRDAKLKLAPDTLSLLQTLLHIQIEGQRIVATLQQTRKPN